MARARNIKPGFFKNEELAEFSPQTRLLFIGLWTLADREGRLEDRPKRIRAELFPFESFEVDSMLAELSSKSFIVRYEVDGSQYIEITNFVKHQDPHYKEKVSEIPPPPGAENKIKAAGVTRTQRQRILERDGYKCVACGSEEHLCIDHILPVSRGGDSSDDNLQVLCLPCNTKKGNRLDGEDKCSRKRNKAFGTQNEYDIERQVEVDSTKVLVDPLIPDSLIPEGKKPARKRSAPTLVEKPEDVAEQVWQDWCALRRAKRSTVSETVLSEARAEACKAGLSLERFLAVWCARGSQGLQAEWLKPSEKGRAPPAGPTHASTSADETRRYLADEAARPVAPVPDSVRQLVAQMKGAA